MSIEEPAPPVLAVTAEAAAARRSVRLGYLFGIAAALLFSSKGVVVKLAYQEGVDAETLLALRLGLSLPVYLVIGALSLGDRFRTGRPLPRLGLVAWSAFVGLLGYYVAAYTDFLGLQYISAQFERMILFTFPLFVVLFGAWFFHLPARREVLIAIGIAYAGLAIMFAGRWETIGGRDMALGTAFVLAAAIAYAFYQLMAKPLITAVGPRLFTCIAMTAASLAALLQFALTHELSDLAVSGTAFWYSVLLAVGATILPSFLLAAALHRISAQANSTIGMLSPIGTIILAWIVLGETLSGIDIAGAALVIVAVGWISLRERNAAA